MIELVDEEVKKDERIEIRLEERSSRSERDGMTLTVLLIPVSTPNTKISRARSRESARFR